MFGALKIFGLGAQLGEGGCIIRVQGLEMFGALQDLLFSTLKMTPALGFRF